jgi:hypothetical protein
MVMVDGYGDNDGYHFRKIRMGMAMVDGDGYGAWPMVDGAQRPCMVMVNGEHASVSNILYNI